jgi:hypothetical protein
MTEVVSSCPHVYKAIHQVLAVLAKEGISKDQTNQAQHYKFRGIDDVYNTLAQHLAAAHLLILPASVSRDTSEKPLKNGGSAIHQQVDAVYEFVSAVDGSKHACAMLGEAMDTADKASNKAMSAAYKYLCFQSFCIPTEGDNDADASTPELGTAQGSTEKKVGFFSKSGSGTSSVYVYDIPYGNEQARGVAKAAKLRFSSKKEGGDNKWRGQHVPNLEAFIVERPSEHHEPAGQPDEDDDIPF